MTEPDNPSEFSRIFTPDDQEAFAQFSGDFNPFHMDSLVARRLLSGETVVHGVHTILFGLDCLASTMESSFELTHFAADFSIRDPSIN